MKTHAVPVFAMATLATAASLGANPDPVRVDPAGMKRVGEVDTRFQSYNVEMVEVTGGRFWAPYRSEAPTTETGAEKPAVPGLDPNAFRMRPPIDFRGELDVPGACGRGERRLPVRPTLAAPARRCPPAGGRAPLRQSRGQAT
jgi:hypothetical protein